MFHKKMGVIMIGYNKSFLLIYCLFLGSCNIYKLQKQEVSNVKHDNYDQFYMESKQGKGTHGLTVTALPGSDAFAVFLTAPHKNDNRNNPSQRDSVHIRFHLMPEMNRGQMTAQPSTRISDSYKVWVCLLYLYQSCYVNEMYLNDGDSLKVFVKWNN